MFILVDERVLSGGDDFICSEVGGTCDIRGSERRYNETSLVYIEEGEGEEQEGQKTHEEDFTTTVRPEGHGHVRREREHLKQPGCTIFLEESFKKKWEF